MTHESETYARAAEHAVSQLADLITPPAGRADVDTRAAALGFSGLINVLLSIDEAIRSNGIDIPTALLSAEDHVCDAIDHLASAVDPAIVIPARPRPWWKGATREDRAAYLAARAELDRVCAEDKAAGIHEETEEYHAANDALVTAMERLPWWQR